MVRAAFTLICALVAAPAVAAPATEAIHMRMLGAGKNCWVFVHPFGASGKFWESRSGWQKRTTDFAERHHIRIYYPDLPAHGLSAPTDSFDYTRATNALQAALEGVCPKPKVIVGGSSGGIIAMRLGARTHARVIGVGVGWSFNDADLKDLIESGEHPSPGFLAYLQHFAEQGPAQVTLMLRFAKELANMGTGPLLTPEEARALRGRLLVIHGDADDFFFNPSTAKLVREIPGTQLYRFPGAGHLEPFIEPYAPVTWNLIDRFGRTGTIGGSAPLPDGT